MIDIHTHIMPGIDDGADNMEESLAMAEMAVRSGVSTIVVTPHANIPGIYENYDSLEWHTLFQKLKHYIKEHNCRIRLVEGMEIFATDDVARKIRNGSLRPINGSRYYLMEVPFDADPYWCEYIWKSVLEMGYVPVIAHPERYFCIQDNPAILYEWMRMGCLSQMNKGSVFGRFGKRAARTARTLLNYNLITCAASDAHSPYMRTTFMADVREYLMEEYGERRMASLLFRNPQRILDNQPIYNENLERPNGRWRQ